MANGKGNKRVKRLVQAIKKERGYLPKPWEYAANRDVEFMEAYDHYYQRGLMAGKALPIKTRELIVIGLLAFRGKEEAVFAHIKRAIKHGATKQEIFEALESAAIPGGAPTFSTGLDALMRVEEEEKESKSDR